MTRAKSDSSVKGDEGAPPARVGMSLIRPRNAPEEFHSLTDYVTTTLKDTILSHALPPGTRLTEEGLARALGVSRLPVREALKILSGQGLIVLRPHGRGAAVAQPTQDMLREVYQVRAALELLSVELATERMGPEDIARLQAVVREGLEAAARSDWRRATVLGSDFHRIIANASSNSHLIELIDGFDEKLRWAHEPVSVERGSLLWEEHRAIADAMERRNRELAVSLMREHTQRSGESLSLRGRATSQPPEVAGAGPICCT